eukprot:m.13629 g.13629  ORF g.13629 m.13629 type:complete len:265 (-) comp10192_c0_seq1:208-1002(-)
MESELFAAHLEGFLATTAATGASTLEASDVAFEPAALTKLESGIFDALPSVDQYDATLLPTMDLLADDLPTDLSWPSTAQADEPSTLGQVDAPADNGEPPQRRSKRHSVHAASGQTAVRDSEEDACSISSVDNSVHGEDGDWQPEATVLVTQEEVDKPASTTRRYNLEGKPKQRRRKPIVTSKQPWSDLTAEERRQQEVLRAERSRQSARDCRKRKKAYMLGLEKQVAVYKEKMQVLQRAFESAQEDNKRLQAENRLLRANMDV